MGHLRRSILPIIISVAVLFIPLAGCGNKDAKQIPKAKDIEISVSVANSPDDETLREIAEKDSTVTKGKIESYTHDKIASLLKQVGFPAENDPRDYSLNLSMSLGMGLKRKILTDPNTSIEVTGGTIVLSVPTLKLDGDSVKCCV